jgi:hypothetical protein
MTALIEDRIWSSKIMNMQPKHHNMTRGKLGGKEHKSLPGFAEHMLRLTSTREAIVPYELIHDSQMLDYSSGTMCTLPL